MVMKKKCLNCKKEFEANNEKQKFCCSDCSNIYNGKNCKRICSEDYKEKTRKICLERFDKKLGKVEEFEVHCEKCKKRFIVKERKSQFPKKEKYFCSRSCANYRTHSNETKNKIRNTLLLNGIKKEECCENCQTSDAINMHKQCKVCNKINKVKCCKSCGSSNVIGKAKYCNECKKNVKDVDLFRKLSIQNTNLQIANADALKILSKEYFTNKKGLIQIREQYGIMYNTIHFFFKKNGVDLRTLSNSVKLAIKEGRRIQGVNTVYESGYHTAWYGKEVFFRSSYERRMMDVLDNMKEMYLYETIRISYNFNEEVRIYITDFYLPERNLIIETKGEWFQKRDKKEIEAKKNAVLSEGYYYMMVGKKELEQYEKGKQL